MTPKLRVTGVRHVYRGESGQAVPSIKEINMTIEDQEFACVVGPSGCGKTTLLRILAGLLAPTEGQVWLDDRDLTGRPGPERGVVFQADAVFPWMTVRENVEFGPAIRGLPPAERAELAAHYIELVGLKGFENAFPKELSGGMRKRVDLARVYAANPEVMLMDEPFGSLDSQTKARMQTELLRIWGQERRTVVFITHDLEEALYLGDRIFVLTARPSTIKEVLVPGFARPRDPSLRVEPEFIKLRRHLEESLNEEINRGRGGTCPGSK